jgi:hypothetical protein
MSMSATAQAALAAALSTRGSNKGKLLRSAPKTGTCANAAWQGAMMAVNPFKASVFAMMMLSEGQCALAEEVRAHFDAMPKAERIKFDADRAALEACGVW